MLKYWAGVPGVFANPTVVQLLESEGEGAHLLLADSQIGVLKDAALKPWKGKHNKRCRLGLTQAGPKRIF